MGYRRKKAQEQMFGVVYFKPRDLNIKFEDGGVVMYAELRGKDAEEDSFDYSDRYHILIAEDLYGNGWIWTLEADAAGLVASGFTNTSQDAFDDFKGYARDAGFDFALADKL